jgi:hypothetical protein
MLSSAGGHTPAFRVHGDWEVRALCLFVLQCADAADAPSMNQGCSPHWQEVAEGAQWSRSTGPL